MSRFVFLFFVFAFAFIFAPSAFAQDSDDDESSDDQPPSAIPQTVADEVVVTGSRIETNVQDVPGEIDIIDLQRLQRPGTKNVLDALSEQSGVKINPRQDNATFNDIELRGLSSNTTSGGNLLILLDGIPQRRLSFGGPYLGALPYDAVYRMELAKGPLSSLYGRNALAGALQLFTDPGSEQQHFSFNTSFEYPTVSTHAGILASGPFAPLHGSSYSFTGSLTKAEGWAMRNKLSRSDLYLHLNLVATTSDEVKVLAGYYNVFEEYVAPVLIDEDGDRLPGIDRDENLAVPGQNNLSMTEYRFATVWSHFFGTLAQTKLSASYWHGDTFWKVGRPSDQPSEGTLMARSASDRHFLEDAYFTELEGSVNYEASDWLTGTVAAGGSYEYQTYRMLQTEITTEQFETEEGIDYTQGIPLDLSNRLEPGRSTWIYGDESVRDTFETNYGVFLRDQTTFIDRIHLSGGVRYDWFDRTQVDPNTEEKAQMDDGAMSPGAGLSVGVLQNKENKVNVYASWGMGFSPIFRAVNNTEFAEVDPERSESIELGAKANVLDRLLEGSLAAYRLKRLDIVAMNPDTRLQENVGDWLIQGIEAGFKVRPLDYLMVYGSYTWREPTIDRYDADPNLEGNKIPGIADQAAAFGVEGHTSFNLGGGLESRYVSMRYGNEANSFELPAYALIDANVYYNFYGMQAAVFAKNLLNQEYYSAVFNGVQNGSAFEGTPLTVGAQLRGTF